MKNDDIRANISQLKNGGVWVYELLLLLMSECSLPLVTRESWLIVGNCEPVLSFHQNFSFAFASTSLPPLVFSLSLVFLPVGVIGRLADSHPQKMCVSVTV